MFNRRRRMLMYMRREDFASYCYVLHKLGLKDVYTEIVSGHQSFQKAAQLSQRLSGIRLCTAVTLVYCPNAFQCN